MKQQDAAPQHGTLTQPTNCCLARLRAEVVHVSRDVREPRALLPSLLIRTLPPKTKTTVVSYLFRPFFHRDVRGAGIYQPAVDHAIQKLRAGACCVGPLVRSCLHVVLCAETACTPHGWIDSPFAEAECQHVQGGSTDGHRAIAALQVGSVRQFFSFIPSQTTEPFPRREMILKACIHKQARPKKTRSVVNHCIVRLVGVTGYSSSRAE